MKNVRMYLMLPLFFVAACGRPADTGALVLSSKNTVSLSLPITSETVKATQEELLRRSDKLPASEPIYLVLNSPGGQIDEGLKLIALAQGLPQKVHTISMFSASMSFIISQYLNTRYATPNAIIMSHRAFADGVGGQIPGSLLTRANFFLSQIMDINTHVAVRAQYSSKQYSDMIADELWMGAEEAKSLRFIDKVTTIRCDSSLRGAGPEQTLTWGIFRVKVTFHKCPLITEPMNAGGDESLIRAIRANKLEQTLFFRGQ